MEMPTLLVDRQLSDRQRTIDLIERLIRQRTGGLIRSLRVEVLPGRVTLSGRTNTYYLKQLATHAAIDAVGTAQLTNAIEVR